MRWHLRLGDTSSEYLKHMKKYEEKLKKINFIRDILDCGTCILAKMESSIQRKKNKS